MKARNYFVSNSSSCSFILFLPGAPSSVEEVAAWLFGDSYQSDEIPAEVAEYCRYSASHVARAEKLAKLTQQSLSTFLYDRILQALSLPPGSLPVQGGSPILPPPYYHVSLPPSQDPEVRNWVEQEEGHRLFCYDVQREASGWTQEALVLCMKHKTQAVFASVDSRAEDRPTVVLLTLDDGNPEPEAFLHYFLGDCGSLRPYKISHH